MKATFWTGRTGKIIKAQGRDSQVIALYLMTCPNSNMIGLYYLPIPTLSHETGIPLEGASEGLRRLSEAHFCHYDPISEHIFVPEMASHQIGESLKEGDKRIIGIKKELEKYRKTPYFNTFLEKYRDAFCLHDVSPLEAPSKPLRSQEQEQDQEQEQEQEILIPDSE